MRALDKNKIYDLSFLSDTELTDLLKWLVENDSKDWKHVSFREFKIDNNKYSLNYRKDHNDWYFFKNRINLTNAKELFYTLENIQVDCRNFTEEQVKEMCKVYENNGYKQWVDEDALKIRDNFTYLRMSLGNEFYITGECYNKTTITYEKFMELFGKEEKSKEFKNLVEVLNEELTEEAYKETSNKLNYELDFNFITQLAERMSQNKHKYEPYNWQKLDNIAELKQALFRHVLEVMNGNYEDDGRMFAHLESIALNAMFINYQLKKKQ